MILDTPQDWADLLKDLGVPGFFVVGLLVIIWKIVKIFSTFGKSWLIPKAETVVSKHIELIDKLEDSFQEITTALSKIIESTSKNFDLQLTHSEILRGHSSILEKQSELLKKQMDVMNDVSLLISEQARQQQENNQQNRQFQRTQKIPHSKQEPQ